MKKNHRLDTLRGGPTYLREPQIMHAQAVEGGYTLDLQSPEVVEDGAVKILVPRHPQCNEGDRIEVRFSKTVGVDQVVVVRRYRYLPDPTHHPLDDDYQVILKPLQSLPPDQYQVLYMVTSRSNNSSLSNNVNLTVLGTPSVIGQIGLCGKYLTGSVGSRVIWNDCVLDPSSVLAEAVPEMSSDPGSSILLRRVPAGGVPEKPFATLQSNDGKQWVCNGDPTKFTRGDVLDLQIESESGAQIYAVMSI